MLDTTLNISSCLNKTCLFQRGLLLSDSVPSVCCLAALMGLGSSFQCSASDFTPFYDIYELA